MHLAIMSAALLAGIGAPMRAVPTDTGFHVVDWYEAAGAAGGTALVLLVDQPVQRLVQDHRSQTSDELSDVFRPAGDARVAFAAAGGLTLAGLLVDDDRVRGAGLRAGASLATGVVAAEVLKFGLGRGRPATFTSATDFRPFTSENDTLGVESRGSFPSGHSVVAFALATSLADDIHRTPATAALYTVAAGTALSRVNDDRHWLSDVVGGAVLGITSARLVSGRWRVFGLRPPTVLLAPEFVSMAWHLDMGH